MATREDVQHDEELLRIEEKLEQVNDEWFILHQEVERLERLLRAAKQEEKKKELESQLSKAKAKRDLANAKRMKAFNLYYQRKAEKEKAKLGQEYELRKKDEEIKRYQQKVSEWEEKIKQRQQLLLEKEQEEEYHQLLEEALKQGYVDCELFIAILVGPPGVGKTCLLHLLLGKKPPPSRNSTGVAESPVTIQIRALSGSKIEIFCEDRWEEVAAENMLPKIACYITKMFSASDAKGPRNPLPKEVEEYLEQLKVSTAGDRDDDGEKVHDSAGVVIHSPLQHKKQPSAAVKEVIDSVMSKLLKLMSSEGLSKGNHKEFFSSTWVYVTDCGGQPQFHELFPLFIHGISAVIFVSRLCDKLDDLLPDDYYKDGKVVGSAKSTHLTTEDQIKCLVRSLLSRSSDCHLPKIVMVGTHLDRIKECSESLDDKNKKLLKMLGPDICKHLVPYQLKKPIFPVNTIEPGNDEKTVAERVRRAIETSVAKKVRVPVWWYILEILLRDLANKLGTRVLSRTVCLEIARRLNFSERAFNAALKFFDGINIIKYSDAIPEVVFVDSQVPLDKISELVQHSYFLLYGECPPDNCDEKWRQFCEEGIVTVEVLRTFTSHYVPGLFECQDLLELLKRQLVVVPLPDAGFPTSDAISVDVVKYFMPALLKMMQRVDLDEHMVFESAAAPLLFQFSHGCRRAGLFCSLIVHLVSHCGWSIQHKNGELILVARNCVSFRPFRDECYVTLIDAFFYIELHVSAPPPSCIEHCPTICEQILDGMNAACKVLKYANDHPHVAFFCPHSGDIDIKSTQDRHAATVSKDGNFFCCTMSPKHFQLEDKHKIWLKGQETKTASTLFQTVGHSASSQVVCTAPTSDHLPSTQTCALSHDLQHDAEYVEQRTLSQGLQLPCTQPLPTTRPTQRVCQITGAPFVEGSAQPYVHLPHATERIGQHALSQGSTPWAMSDQRFGNTYTTQMQIPFQITSSQLTPSTQERDQLSAHLPHIAEYIRILPGVSISSGTTKVGPSVVPPVSPQCYTQRKPTLHELSLLEGRGKTVKIIERVAHKWELLATMLYFEGHDIMRIQNDYPHQGVRASQQVLMEWQMGKGRQPTTWATFIKALDEAGLSEVTKEIEAIIAHPE